MADAIATAFVEVGLRDVGLRRGMADARREVTGFQQAVAATVPGVGALQRAMQFGLAGGALVAGVRLGELAYEMAEAGAQSERLRDAFDSLWSSAGQTGEEALLRLRAASRGTVSDMDLMLAANRASMLGVASSTEQLAELMEIAAFRGRAMGLSMSQAFDNIVTGLGRTSPLILDNLGIVVDMEAANAAYARSLGKAASALTEAEKKQALLNAVLTEGREQIRAAGGVSVDAASQFEILAASIANLQVAAQQGIAGGVTGIVESINTVIAGITQQSEANLARAAKSFDEYLKSSAAQADVTRRAYQAMFGDLGNVLFEATRQQQVSIEQWRVMRQAENDAAAELENFNRLMRGVNSGGLRAAVGDAEALTAALLELNAVTALTAGQLGGELAGEMAFYIDIYSDLVARGIVGFDQALSELESLSARMDMLLQMGAGAPLDLEGKFRLKVGSQQSRNSLLGLYGLGGSGGKSEAQREAERAAEEAARAMRSAVESVIRPTFAGDPGGLLDAMGLHIDTADEDARRLASVMAEGLSSQWTSYFAGKGLLKPEDLADDDTVRAASARILREFQLGLRPELVDKETAKQRVKEILLGQQQTEALVNEIMAELGAEGVRASRQQVQLALGDTSVTATGTASVSVAPVTVQASVNLAPLTAEQISAWMAEAEGVQFDAQPVLQPPSDASILYWRLTQATGIVFDATPNLLKPTVEDMTGFSAALALAMGANLTANYATDIQPIGAGVGFNFAQDVAAGITTENTPVSHALYLALLGDLLVGAPLEINPLARQTGANFATDVTGGFAGVPYVSPLAEAITADFAANSTKLLGISEAIGSYIATVINARVKSEVNIIQGVVDAAIEQMAEGLIEQSQEGGQ